nr:MAG TPA: hypothetical protein [Caudoviricetes sp.]
MIIQKNVKKVWEAVVASRHLFLSVMPRIER